MSAKLTGVRSGGPTLEISHAQVHYERSVLIVTIIICVLLFTRGNVFIMRSARSRICMLHVSRYHYINNLCKRSGIFTENDFTVNISFKCVPRWIFLFSEM